MFAKVFVLVFRAERVNLFSLTLCGEVLRNKQTPPITQIDLMVYATSVDLDQTPHTHTLIRSNDVH